MDARQDSPENPFGMDEDCRNCPALCETRSRVVHGYGDVGADFLFVGEQPGPEADETGIPFAGEADRGLWRALYRLDLCSDPAAGHAERGIDNAFLTHLTRCRDPERGPTDEEIRNCDPFLTAEIRMINPEILVPVGERALATIAAEYTTTPAEEFSLPDDHARTIRGRGFEIVPTVDLQSADDETYEAFVEAFSELMDRDYRQTKGRRSR
ncbi:uracil-DNA glycosylase [Halobacteriales archaeon QS_8_69_26]|nr:MAG: uracil-DNA glycosylase [Halobacteriales archaeon QS_8_69_26]